nr:ribonuclease H-like domain-containing protein [Tanacetum cinerariifolium]
MYSFDLKNGVPSRDLTCLFAKAIINESNLWHRRLGHVNFKTMNKLVKGNLVRGLPSKTFENDHTCVACQKGKQHKWNQANKNADHQEVNGDTSLKKNKSSDDKVGDNTANDAAGKEKVQEPVKVDFNNMEPSTVVIPIPITRANHPKAQIIGDPMLAVQTR